VIGDMAIVVLYLLAAVAQVLSLRYLFKLRLPKSLLLNSFMATQLISVGAIWLGWFVFHSLAIAIPLGLMLGAANPLWYFHVLRAQSMLGLGRYRRGNESGMAKEWLDAIARITGKRTRQN
jgi:hypothetical protein